MANADDHRFDMEMGAMSLPHAEDDDEDHQGTSSASRSPGREALLKCDSKIRLFYMNPAAKDFPSLEDNTEWTGPIEHIDDLPACILRRILGCLRVWEVSPCRLISKRWNDQIMNHTSYPQKTYILLTNDRASMTYDFPEILSQFDPLFRRLRMLRVPQLTSTLPPSIAENITHLELVHCGPITWPVFIDLLTACNGLEELTVRKCPFKWPYDTEEWKNKYIEWVGKIERSGGRFPNLRAVEFRVKDPHDVLYMWKLILKYSTRLQRLSFSCKSPPNGMTLDSGTDDSDDMYETVVELFDVLVEIINRFGKGLELFHSYLIDPPQPRSCSSIVPATSTKSRMDLSKDLTCTIMNRYCTEVIGRINVDVLNLKSFCLYGGEISESSIPKQTDILADFLKSQTSLEKVILPRMKFHSDKALEQLLKNVSKTVRCIRVPTFGRMPECLSFDFQRIKEYYIESHGTPDLQIIVPPGTILPNVKTFTFYNCSDWVWQTVKIMTVVNSFPCLAELLIRDDGTHQCTRIGDTDMQNICRYFPHLKKLHMTNVDCVTDFGFSGICEKECRFMNETGKYCPSPGTKIGYSIATLKELEYLCLFNIGFRVTNVSMIFGFKFPNLRFMTLEGYPKVTAWAVERVKDNNSKLKRWNLQFHDMIISQVVERLQRASDSDERVPHSSA